MLKRMGFIAILCIAPTNAGAARAAAPGFSCSTKERRITGKSRSLLFPLNTTTLLALPPVGDILADDQFPRRSGLAMRRRERARIGARDVCVVIHLTPLERRRGLREADVLRVVERI